MYFGEKMTVNDYVIIDCDVDCAENLTESDIISGSSIQKELKPLNEENMYA